ncbi:IclR family transcriptional regulator [Paracoccus sp. Z330]|uniref:IclR family transcriptional regulator n=1 Tax=Paracoccus onchidii TaxID=3017813 RepID=A0ABT4ZDL1_9RHOB|nr:IclR family transcriptional regulator [Paracoccus onchidii]MDB6177426.1 IclR family transcriptional regulator [Paracoccus onchidii]
MPKRGADSTTPLSRAILVLEEVSRHRTPPSFSTLMKELRLPKSSLHRTLAALTEERLLEFRQEDSGYRLGLRLSGLSLKAVHGLEIRDAVRPEIEDLSKQVQENVLVGQRDDTQLVYVDRIQSQQTLQMISQLGNQAPLHCTGLGKTLLAFSDPEVLTELLPRLTLTRSTEKTICDLTTLQAELATIRERGFAIDGCEHQPEIHCIAAPIYGAKGRVMAAVSISAPVFRVPRATLTGWAPALRETARRITLKLGGIMTGQPSP